MKAEMRKIFLWFIGWRLFLFLVAIVATVIIKEFNPSFPYFDTILQFTRVPPWVWGFGNFDGVHYLRIAATGYKDQFAQAFFPLYPLLINLLTKINVFFPKDAIFYYPQYIGREYFYNGILLSNLLFFFGLLAFYKLLKLDEGKSVAKKSLIFLLSVPTAFFFVSVYSESLFFLLSVLSLYFLRKKNFLFSGIFALFASATRIVGIVLFVVLLVEGLIGLIKEKPSFSQKIKYFIGTFLAPMGTVLYMYYLGKKFGDYFYFLTSQPQFGAERSALPLVTLPQVFYRYLRMILTANPQSYQFFVITLELLTAVVITFILIYSFRKIKLAYWCFCLGVFLLPTLTGTFSSMPRYILMCFMLIPFIVKKAGKYYKFIIVGNLLMQMVLLGLFIRGYWIA